MALPQTADTLPAVERELVTFILLAEFAPAHYRGQKLRVVDRDGGEVLVARSARRRNRVVARVYSTVTGAYLRTIVADNGRIHP